MLRYMICPVIGAGTDQNPYRAAVSDAANVNSSALIPTNTSGPNIGKPKYGFAFCFVATPQLSFITTISNGFVFPDYPLDGRMDGMDPSARTGMKQSVEAYNLDGAGLHFDASNTDSESYRDLLTRLMQQIEPAATINALGVNEVAGG